MLTVALAIVIAFAGSFIFGLRRDRSEPAVSPPDVDTPPPAVVHTARGRVEVLNASGKAGLARMATQQLRDAGFDVVQFGNAAPQVASQVLDRVGNSGVAAAAGAALGITSITSAIDSTRYVDATIILGSDWPIRDASPATNER